MALFTTATQTATRAATKADTIRTRRDNRFEGKSYTSHETRNLQIPSKLIYHIHASISYSYTVNRCIPFSYPSSYSEEAYGLRPLN